MTDEKTLDALYRDTVRIADRARDWFDGPGARWRTKLPPMAQAQVAIESLGVTTRLMAVMTWLLDPAQTAGSPPAFAPPPITDFAADHPLNGHPGADIARASRQLVARATAMGIR